MTRGSWARPKTMTEILKEMEVEIDDDSVTFPKEPCDCGPMTFCMHTSVRFEGLYAKPIKIIVEALDKFVRQL